MTSDLVAWVALVEVILILGYLYLLFHALRAYTASHETAAGRAGQPQGSNGHTMIERLPEIKCRR